MKEPIKPRPTALLVCVNRRFKGGEPSCAARGSVAIAKAIEQGVHERQIDIAVERIICLGQCTKGPTLKLAPAGDFILGTTAAMVPGILDRLEKACGVKKTRKDDPPLHLLGS